MTQKQPTKHEHRENLSAWASLEIFAFICYKTPISFNVQLRSLSTYEFCLQTLQNSVDNRFSREALYRTLEVKKILKSDGKLNTIMV